MRYIPKPFLKRQIHAGKQGLLPSRIFAQSPDLDKIDSWSFYQREDENNKLGRPERNAMLTRCVFLTLLQPWLWAHFCFRARAVGRRDFCLSGQICTIDGGSFGSFGADMAGCY